jgi:hypothetical protein
VPFNLVSRKLIFKNFNKYITDLWDFLFENIIQYSCETSLNVYFRIFRYIALQKKEEDILKKITALKQGHKFLLIQMGGNLLQFLKK